MARSYKRDSQGRFSGGGGGGGKVGKSAKNEGARAKYKKASGEAREAARGMAAATKRGKVDALYKAESKRTKSNLTRVTNQLTGKSGKKGAKGSASVEAARAAGRAKGQAMAKKTSARNAALDAKAAAYGGGKAPTRRRRK